LYVIVWYAGGPYVLIPSTSTIPIPQQCYFAISFVLFIHSFRDGENLSKSLPKPVHLRRTSVQRDRMSWSRLLKMETAAKVDPFQEQVLLCLSP